MSGCKALAGWGSGGRPIDREARGPDRTLEARGEVAPGGSVRPPGRTGPGFALVPPRDDRGGPGFQTSGRRGRGRWASSRIPGGGEQAQATRPLGPVCTPAVAWAHRVTSGACGQVIKGSSACKKTDEWGQTRAGGPTSACRSSQKPRWIDLRTLISAGPAVRGQTWPRQARSGA